jgi:hypothetical protein
MVDAEDAVGCAEQWAEPGDVWRRGEQGWLDAEADANSPITVAIWLRSSAPTATPRGASSAATATLRHIRRRVPGRSGSTSPGPAFRCEERPRLA